MTDHEENSDVIQIDSSESKNRSHETEDIRDDGTKNSVDSSKVDANKIIVSEIQKNTVTTKEEEQGHEDAAVAFIEVIETEQTLAQEKEKDADEGISMCMVAGMISVLVAIIIVVLIVYNCPCTGKESPVTNKETSIVKNSKESPIDHKGIKHAKDCDKVHWIIVNETLYQKKELNAYEETVEAEGIKFSNILPLKLSPKEWANIKEGNEKCTIAVMRNEFEKKFKKWAEEEFKMNDTKDLLEQIDEVQLKTQRQKLTELAVIIMKETEAMQPLTDEQIRAIEKQAMEDLTAEFIKQQKKGYSDDIEDLKFEIKSNPEEKSKPEKQLKELESFMIIVFEPNVVYHVKFDDQKKINQVYVEEKMHYWNPKSKCLSDKEETKNE